MLPKFEPCTEREREASFYRSGALCRLDGGGTSAAISGRVHFQFFQPIFSSRLMQYNGFHFQFSSTAADLFNNLQPYGGVLVNN